MAEVVRPWRGVSADERRTARRARLVEAGLNVVGAHGVAATTVERVCADAQLTKRYFYESFADLDALLVAAADDLVALLRERMDAAVARTPGVDERRHAIVTVLIDVLAEDPRRARLYVESPGHKALQRRRERSIAEFTEFVAAVLPAAPEPPLPNAARLLAIRLLVGGTTELVTSWLSGAVDADRDVIIETIVRLGGRS